MIIFDGIDGSGKTTQLTSAKVTLESLGWQVENFRYLGGSPIGEKLREVMFAPIKRPPEVDFYISLAVQYSLAVEIDKARERGSVILLDRGPLSLLAYDFYGNQYDLDQADHYLRLALDQFHPELIVLLDCDIELALRRSKREISGDYFGSQPLAYFERVNEGYRVGSQAVADILLKIDASLSIESINDQAIGRIRRLLEA